MSSVLRFGHKAVAVNTPDAVRRFREALIAGGFAHHGPAGQLMARSAGQWLFVRTGIDASQYRVYVYRRTGGFHGSPTGATVVRIGLGEDTHFLIELARALVGWDGIRWPVHPALEPVPEGRQW